MRVQYASDLHLEFADNWRFLREQPLKVSGEILILAGDIGYLEIKITRNILSGTGLLITISRYLSFQATMSFTSITTCQQ